MALTTLSPNALGSVAGSTSGTTAAALAAANASALTDVAQVYGERTPSFDAGGIDDAPLDNFVGSWFCLIQKGRLYKEDVKTGAEESLTSFTAYFELSADVRPQDEIRCNGQTFEVVGNDRGLSSPSVLTVQLTKIT